MEALRKCGASVVSLAAVGKGCPDLLVGWRGENLIVEVKDGEKPKSKQKLRPAQEKFHKEWRGQICVVQTIEQALNSLYQSTEYTR